MQPPLLIGIKCNIHIANEILCAELIKHYYKQKRKLHSSCGNTKDIKQPKQSRERRMELEESTVLTSAYTTKLQSSRHYGTGTKIDIKTNRMR